jgi:uncharacterized repeat protein (TIGR01451 family)
MPSQIVNKLFSVYRKFRFAVIGAVIAVLLGFALYRGVVLGEEKKEQAKPAAPKGNTAAKNSGSDVDASKDGISLLGHLSRDSAGPGGIIRFWITIENKSGDAVQNVHFVDFFTPGFNRPSQFSGGCSGANWDQICKVLAARTAITLWGDLSAADDGQPKENSLAVVAWDSPGHPGQSAVVQLGEIERLSWWEALWKWLTQLDVGIPTLTAILVALYGIWKKRHEDTEAKLKVKTDKEELLAKAERERVDKLAAEQREQHQQTWNLMLPQANHLSLRYYIPMANAVVTFAWHIKVCRDKFGMSGTPPSAPATPTEDEYLSALFDVVQLQWHRLRMKRAIGGYYFKSRTAESVTEQLFQKHRINFEVTSPARYVVLTRFVALLRRNYEIGDFIAGKASWDAEQQQFYTYFKSWIANAKCECDLDVLGAMGKVLWYESNRPFLNWYQEQPPVVLTQRERAEIEEIGVALTSEDANMPKRVADYVGEIMTGVSAKPKP